MDWKRALQREAVAIALPKWEWRADDVVDITNSWEEPGWEYGYGGESYQTSGRFETTVTVHRADAEQDRFGLYEGAGHAHLWDEEAAGFWNDLLGGRGATLIEEREPVDAFSFRPDA